MGYSCKASVPIVAIDLQDSVIDVTALNGVQEKEIRLINLVLPPFGLL
jgi:hypothetical protein